jgi:uncharacterized small protein (DUF1192 family)
MVGLYDNHRKRRIDDFRPKNMEPVTAPRGQRGRRELVDSDELEPVIVAPKAMDMETMSVEALEDYIASLKAEIARAEAAIKGKGSALDIAESFFKKR